MLNFTLSKVSALALLVKNWAFKIDVSPILNVAKEGDVNVKVWIEHHFSGGALTYMPNDWLCENNETVIFATYNDAANWVNWQLKIGYFISPDECDTLNYIICK